MKKIIEGKAYNTETAEEIGNHYNHKSYSDFDLIDMTLYRTKKGAFFMVQNNGCRAGGDDFYVVSEEDAREWVEEYANEKYEEIFGECEEA